MMQHNITILAIQENTAWSKKLSDVEITSIERHCDKWGYWVSISKLQILIIDKQLTACHRETNIYKEGCIIHCRMELAKQQFVSFVPVCGIPHSIGEKIHLNQERTKNDDTLQKMGKIKERIKSIIKTTLRSQDIIFIFGDLQDTPDNSKNFHYSRCRIPKHPLGVAKTCEEEGLTCTIYKHLDSLAKPIISRHGTQGGRFIDGMYTCSQGIESYRHINYK